MNCCKLQKKIFYSLIIFFFLISKPTHSLEVEGFAKVIKIFDLELDGCRIITNFGKHGGQEVPHLHFHLFGGKDIGSMIS